VPRGRHAVAEWVERVESDAADALRVVRRLAAGITPTEVTAVQVALHEVAQRLAARRTEVPSRLPGADEIADLLDVATRGARAEAAMLSGVTVMRNDRRAFLDALRALRETSTRLAPPTPGAAAARRPAAEVAPSLTPA
jgi:hypothetical protein